MRDAVIVGFWIGVGIMAAVAVVAVVALLGRLGLMLGQLIADLITRVLRRGYRRAGRGRCECGGQTYPNWLGGDHNPGRW